MPTIKPVSDLQDYPSVLHDVSAGSPVFLTQDGRGRYALVDITDYEATQAAGLLLSELAKGERSAEKSGWLTADEVEASLGIAHA
jgi:hypothetical protein